MADLPPTSPTPPRLARHPALDATGALLGAVIWLEVIALGLPSIVTGTRGYGVLPLAVFAGAVLARTRARKVLWAAALGFGVLLTLVAYTPIMRWPTRALIRSDPIESGGVQAIVVLSGGITADGYLQGSGLERLLTGASLVRRGVADTLILSRERVGRGASQVTSDADQQRILALLAPPPRVLVVDSVHSTRDEAVHMAALARTRGLTRVAVVTSPLHTRRACATFAKVGFRVTCVASDSRDVALQRLPLVDRVRAFRLALYELAALTLYRARGWI
jgi:uncharacterized SAM-binding protein YcdF (DUF218 family)